MTNGTPPVVSPPTTTQHLATTTKWAVGAGLVAAATVVAAPVLLPVIGLGALATAVVGVGTALPWLGATVGGVYGYFKSAP
jgi:hypothetical protein